MFFAPRPRRRPRPRFRPTLDRLPSRIAPTVYAPPPDSIFDGMDGGDDPVPTQDLMDVNPMTPTCVL